MSTDGPNYKDTLSLPQTSFPMRGDLVKKEPARLEQWEQNGLYERIQKRRIEQLHKAGSSARGISESLNLKIRTVRKWISRIKKGILYPLKWDVL